MGQLNTFVTNVLAFVGVGFAMGCASAPKTNGASPATTASRVGATSSSFDDWFLVGSAPQFYRIDSDSVVKHGVGPSIRLSATKDPGDEFGSLVRSIPAATYRGKRIRFSAMVKTDAVTGWAGLWMSIARSDGKNGPSDDMLNRSIHGTTDWTWYRIVLDVPRDAQVVRYGAAQAGLGTSWIDEYQIEAVKETVSTTALTPRDRVAYCAAHTSAAIGSDLLIEDVEDGNRRIRKVDSRAGQWWLEHDDGCHVMPNDPSPSAPGGSNSSHYAMRGAARDCSSWGFDLGFSLNATGIGLCAYDVSRYDGVYFWARSGQASVPIHFRVGTRQTTPAEEGGDGFCDAQPNGCWDDYRIDITLDPTWKLYSATWSQLAQMGWGRAVAFDTHAVNGLHWSNATPSADYREIWIDQVGFFKGTPPTTAP